MTKTSISTLHNIAYPVSCNCFGKAPGIVSFARSLKTEGVNSLIYNRASRIKPYQFIDQFPAKHDEAASLPVLPGFS